MSVSESARLIIIGIDPWTIESKIHRHSRQIRIANMSFELKLKWTFLLIEIVWQIKQMQSTIFSRVRLNYRYSTMITSLSGRSVIECCLFLTAITKQLKIIENKTKQRSTKLKSSILILQRPFNLIVSDGWQIKLLMRASLNVMLPIGSKLDCKQNSRRKNT